MARLFINNQEVNSVFSLLGTKENDMTFSVAYALSSCRVFLQNFLSSIGYKELPFQECDRVQIILQSYETGITDIEIILLGQFHIIVEAKRGWNFPSIEQISKYLNRNSFKGKEEFKKVLIFNESTPEFTSAHFSHELIEGVPIEVFSWKLIKAIVIKSKSIGRDFENRILKELEYYLETVSTMQRKQSNRVYVVSLGGTPPGWSISFIDVVRKYNKYFHPVGGGRGGWPADPPNYIAFRFHGKLQSIHHIDKYEVFRNPNQHFNEIPSADNWEPHYLYHLGPAIRPAHEVRAGAKIVRSMRVWAELDLLLTSSTIQEARDLTQSR